MMLSQHMCVLGFNESSAFAVHGSKVFAAVANNVAVIDANQHTTMLCDGSSAYQVHKLTVSSHGMLCVSERRLAVSLIFYDTATQQKTHEIESITTSHAEDLCFSSTSFGTYDTLFVLCTIPNSTVKIIQTQNGRAYSVSHVVEIRSPLYHVLHYAPFTQDHLGFVVVGERAIAGYVLDTGVNIFEVCLQVDDTPQDILCSAFVPIGVVVGSRGGHVMLCRACNETFVELASLCDGDEVSVVCALNRVEKQKDDCFVCYGTNKGDMYVVACQPDTTPQQLYRIHDPVCRIIFTPAPISSLSLPSLSDSDGCMYFSTPDAIHRLTMSSDYCNNISTTNTIRECTSHIVKQRCGDIVACESVDEHTFVAVCRNGSLLVGTTHTMHYYKTGCAASDDDDVGVVVGASVVVNQFAVLLVYQDGSACYHDLHDGARLWCAHMGVGQPVLLSRASKDGHVIICTTSRMHFYEVSRTMPLTARGSVCEDGMLTVSAIRWLDNTDDLYFLLAFDNGELLLLSFPQSGCAETVHGVDSMLLNMWRLDLPLVDFLPCYYEQGVMHVLAHSVDKETKLYLIDGRVESEAKLIRPVYILPDHEGGGTCLQRFDSQHIISGGKDGRVVLREIRHYQVKLTPAPPSKERRSPVMDIRVRQCGEGSVRHLCVCDGWVVVCGSDSVIALVATPLAQTEQEWVEPVWTVATPTAMLHPARTSKSSSSLVKHVNDYNKNTDENNNIDHTDDDSDNDSNAANIVSSNAEEMHAYEAERSEIVTAMSRLRCDWQAILAEKDMDLPVEELLLPEEQNKFEEECNRAVAEMHTAEHYHALYNAYVQDTIIQNCCQTMAVAQARVTSCTDANLHVRNFALSRETNLTKARHRKLLLLRKIQRKAAVGYRFAELNDDATNSALTPSSANNDISDNKSTSSTNDGMETPFAALLYVSHNVYTRTRAAIQSHLLQLYIRHMKERFNSQFDELRQQLRHTLGEIQDRTALCVVIAKQLGELPSALFDPLINRDDDPDSLFTVYDDELDAEVRALIPVSNASTVYSLSNEAALQRWMDGLEKEVDVLAIQLSLPDFADDTRDTFVPEEEWTDEQITRMEAYNTKLKEETAALDIRKEALRNEFAMLQQHNQQAAESLNAELRQLQRARFATTECMHARQLQRVQLRQHFMQIMVQQQSYVRELLQSREQCKRKLRYANMLLESRRSDAREGLNQRDRLCNQEANVEQQARNSVPFNDPTYGERLFRRFQRWLQRTKDEHATSSRNSSNTVQQSSSPPLPSRDKPAEEFPLSLWNDFCAQCGAVAELRMSIAHAEQRVAADSLAVAETEKYCAQIQSSIDAVTEEVTQRTRSLLPEQLNTSSVYYVDQGQIQDETAIVRGEEDELCMRWTCDVEQYNDLIMTSFDERVQLMTKRSQRRKAIRLLQWEKDKLEYEAGTMDLELRQLHTMRVTSEMQEWINGNGELGEANMLRSIDRSIELVKSNMQAELQGLHVTIRRLQNQIAERNAENALMDRQCHELQSTVKDAAAIQRVVGAYADGPAQMTQRAREIYATSTLEETARGQQEELLRLKQELDRLRERTFPSFAVVSKRTL